MTAASGSLAAQPQLFRAHTFSIDLSTGVPTRLFTVAGEAGSATGVSSSVVDDFVRLTYSFNDRVGVFAQIGDDITSISEYDFLSAVNKADGARYRYRLNGSSYNEVSGHEDSYFLGVSFNWGGGKVQYVARLGAGLVVPELDNCSYERLIKDGSSGPEYFTYDKVYTEPSNDFLLDAAQSYEAQLMPGLLASCQVVRHVRKGIYFFLEPGVMVPFGKMKVQEIRRGSKPFYEASNWVESMAYGDSGSSWVDDPASSTSQVRSISLSPVFKLDFGIGFTITPKKYRHEK